MSGVEAQERTDADEEDSHLFNNSVFLIYFFNFTYIFS